MSSAVDTTSAVTLLSAQQIETLQQQIRQFKNLGKKFSESRIPKMIENLQNPSAGTSSKGPAKEIPKDGGKDVGPTSVTGASGQSAAAAQPALSWQCFNSLLFCGPNKFPQDGAISFSSSVRLVCLVARNETHSPFTVSQDFGCFMKSAHLPLVVTTPYAAALREKALALAAKARLRTSPQPSESLSMDVEAPAESPPVPESPLLWVLQRQMRAALVKQQLTGNPSATPAQLNAAVVHPPVALGPTNYVTELLAHRSFYRNRKQQRRDVKAWEKEDRRRRLELEDRRKKKATEYHKALLAHREDFFRFHKSRKFGEGLCKLR
jgi:hypothetical protein